MKTGGTSAAAGRNKIGNFPLKIVRQVWYNRRVAIRKENGRKKNGGNER